MATAPLVALGAATALGATLGDTLTPPTPAPAAAAPAAAATSVFQFEVPNVGMASIDIAGIPPETRMELLKGAIASTVKNRVNVANQRHLKKNAGWAAYDKYVEAVNAYNAAKAADPLTDIAVPTPVAQPTEARSTIDLIALTTAAIAAIVSGELRTKSDAPAKSRAPKDPVDTLVTHQVQREVFAKEKARNPKYTFGEAVKQVGPSGIAYLKGKIAELVAKGGVQTDLDKFMEATYLKPARIMAGVEKLGGKASELPNIL